MRLRAVLLAVLVAVLAAPAARYAGLETFWENLKLRASRFQQVFRDSGKELRDIRQQGVDPEETSRIRLDLLVAGGPPKDGIPSIDRPAFDTAETTPFRSHERVVGVEIRGDARAYPYGILNWHEIVNDTVGGVPVTVSYCPLCDTMLVHERGDTTFGVSGKLFQSCLVMYDRSDDTLYAQPWALGIVGPKVNRFLALHPVTRTTLGEWLSVHPDSRILSPETGYARDYFQYPYGSYAHDESLVFPVRGQEGREVHPKEIVSYVWRASSERHPRDEFAGPSAVVVHEEVRRKGRVEVGFGDRVAVARWDRRLGTVVFHDEASRRLVSSSAFAFVYPAFFGGSVSGGR